MADVDIIEWKDAEGNTVLTFADQTETPDLTALIAELQNTTAAMTAVLEQLTHVVSMLQSLPDALTAIQTAVDAIEVTMTPMAGDVARIGEAADQITGRQP